jgi:hypothetical protein
LAEVEAWLEQNPAPYVRAHALQLAAELKLAGPDAGESAATVQECLATYSSLPAPPERAAAQLAFARRALRAGVRLPIGEWLEDAAGVFARVEDRHQLAQALALHVEWLKTTRAEHAPVAARSG